MEINKSIVEFILKIVLSIIFIIWGSIEIKTGRVLLRRKITREGSPLFYWVEVMIAFILAGIILFQAINEF